MTEHLPTRRYVAPTSACALTVAAIVAALSAAALAGCGPSPSAGSPAGRSSSAQDPGPAGTMTVPAAAGRNLVDEGYAGRFKAAATVLESRGHGPQLCLGAVATSLPPQCGGPDVAGWSWKAVPHQDVNGTRWGDYVVVGRFDGTTFTLEPGGVLDRSQAPAPAPVRSFDTPCPEPAGGWRPPDPATATDDAMTRVTELAPTIPGYAALWIDQNMTDPGTATADNDPARIILNVTTTRDPAELERRIRTVWGGALCVGRAPRTEAELSAVQQQLNGLPGLLGSAPDPVAGRVDVTVIRATRQQASQLDARYGVGTVRLIGALEPLD